MSWKGRLMLDPKTGATVLDRSYKAWLFEVDALVWTKGGCSVDDLADPPLRDWFEDGLSPKSAARRALQREGF